MRDNAEIQQDIVSLIRQADEKTRSPSSDDHKALRTIYRLIAVAAIDGEIGCVVRGGL